MRTFSVRQLLLLLFTLPATLLAQYDYLIEGDSITITKFNCSSPAAVIPDTMAGLPVTKIGDQAFLNCINLVSVEIPKGVTHVGTQAFYGCSSLARVKIPDSAIALGNGAFYGCASLTNAALPNGLTSVGDSAFAECTSLTRFDVPDSVVYLGNAAFSGCTNLATVWLGNGITNLGFQSFLNCTGLTQIALPDDLISIGSFSFFGCHRLAAVTLPNTLAIIGGGAFFGCASLASITIPQSVTEIRDAAFFGNSSLHDILVEPFNSFFSSVDGVLFNLNQTMLIQYPGGKTGTYVIPAGVGLIGSAAFENCEQLTVLTVPPSVTVIGYYALVGCHNLTAINVDPINPAYSSIDGVLFNKNVSVLIQYPGGKLGFYTVPDLVRSIGVAAFSSCTRLPRITFPQPLQGIGYTAFEGCSALTGIYFLQNAPTNVGLSIFARSDEVIVYFLPSATGWGSTFGDRPAVAWNPRVSTGDADFGVRANQFGFTITGHSGMQVAVEACSDLANPVWTRVETVTLMAGTSIFNDFEGEKYFTRLYRLQMP